MKKIALHVRSITPFGADRQLDEDATSRHVDRLASVGSVIFLAAGNVGEGFTLADGELDRLYRVGVEASGGRSEIWANLPEHVTAAETIRQARLAIDAGCDGVVFYGPAARHGLVVTPEEFRAFFDTVLSAVACPVVLSPQAAIVGVKMPPAAIADIANQYEQVTGLNINADEATLISLRDRLARTVAISVPVKGCLDAFAVGADALNCPQANVAPRSCRDFADRVEQGDLNGAAPLLVGLLRLVALADTLGPVHPRWIKAAQALLHLPGGTLREPHILPQGARLDAFRDGLVKLGLPEIDAMAKAAGLA